MSENSNKNRSGSRTRRPRGTSRQHGEPTAASPLRIGSRDILGSSEILSPYDTKATSPKPSKAQKAVKESAPEKVVAPTHNRKGRKNRPDTAKASAEAPAAKANNKKKTVEQPAAAPEPAAKTAPKQNRKRRGAPTTVAVEDSIVKTARTLPPAARGDTYSVRPCSQAAIRAQGKAPHHSSRRSA